ncbi:hypothetical protein H311_00904, partial [Anncaliia algerae PRA109]
GKMFESERRTQDMSNQEKGDNAIGASPYKVLEFETKLPKTNILIKQKLPYLSSSTVCDFNNWINTFEDIKESLQWNDNESMQVLKELLKHSNYDLTNLTEDYIKNRKWLMDIAYPKEAINMYLCEIDSIKQNNYHYLEDYIKNIKRCLESYAVAARLTKKEYERKFEESFLRGLGDYTSMEVSKLNMETIEETINYLFKIEKKVIIKTEEKIKSKSNKEISPTRMHQAYDKPQEFRKKFCSIHKSNSHNTKDCYLNSKGKNKEFISKPNYKSHDDSSKGLVLTERSFEKEIFELNCIVNDIKVKATIDTGSSRSCIGKSIVEKCGIKKEELPEKLNILSASGDNITISEYCLLPLKIIDINKIYHERFYIVDKLPVDMIIGNDVLIKNNCIINLKDQTMMFNDYCILFNKEQAEYNHYLDKEIMDTVLLNKSNKDLLLTKIKNYKILNNNFNTINAPPVKINIINKNRIFQSK